MSLNTNFRTGIGMKMATNTVIRCGHCWQDLYLTYNYCLDTGMYQQNTNSRWIVNTWYWDGSLGSNRNVTVNSLPKIALDCNFNPRTVLERCSGFSENKLMQQTAILSFYLIYLSESQGNRIYGRIPSKLHLFMYQSINLIVEFNFIQFRRVILYGQKPYNSLTETCSEL